MEQQAFCPKMAVDGLHAPDPWIFDHDVLRNLAEDDRKELEFIQTIDSEKFSSARASSDVLSSVLRLHKEYMNAKPMTISHQLIPDWYKAEQLKISSPIPAQKASRGLISAVAPSMLDPSDMLTPLEKLNDEFDEGLAFPSYYTDIKDNILEAVANEKIVCHRATASIIQEVLSLEKLRKLEYQKPTYHHQLNEVRFRPLSGYLLGRFS